MLWQRLITGPLLILMLIGLAWLDETAATSGLVDPTDGSVHAWSPRGMVLLCFCALVVAPLLAREIAGMLARSGSAVHEWPCMVAAVLGAGSMWWLGADETVTTKAAGTALAVPIALITLIAFALMRRRSAAGASSTVAGVLLSWAYAGLPWAFWIALDRAQGPAVLAGAILTVKSTDIGAYFTGMAIGRTKLIPWLSPGKTREGFVGGLVTGAGVGALLAWWSGDCAWVAAPIDPRLGAIAGAVFGIIGPIGDLAESLLKREARVKDSGQLLPGMGGVHDVAVSLLLTAPLAWLLLA
jgi:phosphatidate cytidylyltransferase